MLKNALLCEALETGIITAQQQGAIKRGRQRPISTIYIGTLREARVLLLAEPFDQTHAFCVSL